MKALKEITAWEFPNHIYITNDSRDKLHGYVVNDEFRTLTKPLRFETTRRKFTEVENIWMADSAPADNTRQVTGSKGEIYTITEVDGVEKCSCPGFKFKRECKHLTK